MPKRPKDLPFFEYYENGQKMSESHFKNDKLDGLATEWHENGQKKSEVHWKNGKQHGLATAWYENGQKASEAKCNDNKLVSVSVWKPDGEPCPETKVVDGSGIGVEYYDSGKKKKEVYWNHNELAGFETEWHENGQKKSESHCKNGERDGLDTYWYENGQKKSEEHWKNGKQHGLATEWYENGQKKSEEHSRNDLTVKRTSWDENGEIVSQRSYSHGIRASYIPNQFLIWPYMLSLGGCVLWIPVFYSSWFGSGELAEKVFSRRDCGMLMSLASLLIMALLVYTAIALVVDKLHSGDSFYDWLKGYSDDDLLTDALIIVCYIFPGSLIALVLFFVFGFNSTPTVLLASSLGWFFCLCFLPTFVAIKKDHPQFVPLAIVNFFFGASVIGWAGCLAWAFWKFDKPDSD